MKVSIITPSFNQGEFIERTLQSVADQRDTLPEHVELEHVVFDGGSTDNTTEILQKFHPKVQWVSEKDKGQADAVNKGIRNTTGEIIGWLNSDDIYYPGAIACITEFFNDNPTIDMVYGMADHIDKAGYVIEPYPTEPWSFERLKETCIICQPALFFRRHLIDQYGVLDESLNYCMDYEYWLRLGKAGVRMHYIEEKLAGSRFYADNKTLRARVKVHQEINDVFKKLLGTVPDRWLFNYAHAIVEQKIKRQERPAWFMWNIIFFSAFAAWRWNRRFFPTMKDPLLHWVRF